MVNAAIKGCLNVTIGSRRRQPLAGDGGLLLREPVSPPQDSLASSRAAVLTAYPKDTAMAAWCDADNEIPVDAMIVRRCTGLNLITQR